MATYPLSTLAPTIDSSGIHVPSYDDIYQSLIARFKQIFGADIYVAPDSQDGQWLAVIATAIYDANQAAVAVFNAFSPASAIGEHLSSIVKINGIRRRGATHSQVDLKVVGQAGSVITSGQAEDTAGNKWNLPATVVIPLAGEITVTATAADPGAITASAGTITKIATPTLGWQSVTNLAQAVAGLSIELDSELRSQQAISTALPSLSVLDGTVGAVASITGVTRLKGYENDSNVTDADGIPAHNVALVVEGGDSQAIGNAIAIKKTPGTPTYGTTSVTTVDAYGLPNTIKFFRPTTVVIGVEVTIKALAGYTTGFAAQIQAAVAAQVKTLGIGDDVLITKLYGPATLPGNAAGSTFDLTQIRIKKDAGAFGTVNIPIAFNEVADCNSAIDVTVIVT